MEVLRGEQDDLDADAGIDIDIDIELKKRLTQKVSFFVYKDSI